ncbi:helix-turn-helix domain-containing protein [Anaeromicropila populeti]|nr:AraC family transcriptional regulator [Anaeromicropila populeti]
MTRALQEYEMMFVTNGTLYIADENQKYTVPCGEYLIMQPTIRQYGFHPSKCSFYWFHFLCGSGHMSFSEQEVIPHMEPLNFLISQLQDCTRLYGTGQLSNYLFTSMLLELNHQLSAKEHIVNSSKEQICAKIKSYVEWNPLCNIQVSEIAKQLGYHEKYLSAVFKSVTGISLKQYLIQKRMEYAKNELADSSISIAQISNTLGFSDSHNFSHAFKKSTGFSPTEYRQRVKKC